MFFCGVCFSHKMASQYFMRHSLARGIRPFYKLAFSQTKILRVETHGELPAFGLDFTPLK